VSALDLAVLCTGLHRSGTSLCAEILHAGGLPLGTRLISAAPSNPDGHFEDAAVVGLHDKLLREAGSDWRFHDEVALPATSLAIAPIRRYVAERNRAASGAVWAVKDPRASLFLEAWAHALGAQGRFLFVIRPWEECLSSLLERHARDLARLVRPEARAEDASFWAHPGLLGQMALAYGERLLEFTRGRTDQAVCISCRLLADPAEVMALVHRRWGLHLAPAPRALAKPDLMRAADSSLAALIAPVAARRLRNVWTELEALCEGRHTESSMVSAGRSLPHSPLLGRTFQKLAAVERRRFDVPEVAAPFDPARGSLEQVSALLSQEQLPKSADLTPVLDWLEQHRPGDVNLLDKLSRRAVDSGQLELAERSLLAALGSTRKVVALHVRLGSVYARLERMEEAEHQYALALKIDPANANAAGAMASLLRRQGRLTEAISLLEKAIAGGPNLWVAMEWAQICMEQGRYAEVLARLDSFDQVFPQHRPAWLELRGNALSPSDRRAALRYFSEAATARVADADLLQMLADLVADVNGPAHQRDLLNRLLTYWTELLGMDELCGKLCLRSNDSAAPASGESVDEQG
jgi:tetratricopeptide (TPR) repeat protein